MTGMTATINNVVKTVVSNAARRFITESNVNLLGNEFVFGNSRKRSDGFDRDGRLYGRITDGKQGFGLKRDANGRINEFENYRDPGQYQSFLYDNLDRLTSANTVGFGTQRAL